MEKAEQNKYSLAAFIRGVLLGVRLPNLLIIVLSQYFVAIFLINNNIPWQDTLFSLRLFLLSLSTVIIAAAGYLINDYYDVKIDLINKPDHVIVGKLVKRRQIMALHTVFNFTAIAIGSWIDIIIGLVHFGSAVLLWLYSNQLKRLPFIGNFCVGLLTGASILIVSLFYNESHWLVFTYAFFAFAMTLIREMIKDMEDWKGDITHGCITLPIIWGIRKTKNLIYLLLGIFVISLIYFIFAIQNITLTTYFLILIMPMAYFTYLLIKADTQKKFNQLSLYCKLLMLSGILSMSFF